MLPGTGNAEEVIDDAAQDDQDQDIKASGFESEENPDPNKGGEREAVGEGDGGDQEDLSQDAEGQDSGVDPRDETISELRERLEKLEKGPEKRESAPEPYKEPTDEEWMKIEDDTGLSRKAIKFQAGQMANLYNRIMTSINAKFGKSEKENSITALSKQKGFQDAGKFRKGMEEFLGDYDESMHSNEKLLKNAYFYAKGKGTGDAVRHAANATERNKRISGSGRPASPNSGDRRPSTVVLTNQQRFLAKKAGMSEKEYADFLPKRRK